MKLTKLLLTSTTALGLSMTAAFANNNDANLIVPGNYNDALIEQDGNGNQAGTSNQAPGINQLGDYNQLDIEQFGTDNETGRGDRFEQDGNNNELDVLQDGTENVFDYMIQTGRSLGSGYTDNILSIEQDGNGNRVKEVRQTRVGTVGPNEATYEQVGNNNNIGGRTGQRGDNNSLNILQDGYRNAINPTTFPDEGNELGLSLNDAVEKYNQYGNNNEMNLTQEGNDNEIYRALQVGDGNNASVLQDGRENDATLVMIGDSNYADMQQIGNFNEMTLDIMGNGNNDSGLSNPFTGYAADARNHARSDGATGLSRGDLWQDGSSNKMDILVTGSDNNSFAMWQNGYNHVIDGEITGGDNNQVVVAQSGNRETATFTISGSNNNAGIIQQ